MSEIIIAVLLVYSSLLLWTLIGSKGHWIWKMFMICVGIYIIIPLTIYMDSLLGWPTENKLPNKFRIYSIIIQEPSIRSNNEGSIYMSLSDMEPKYNKLLIDLYPNKKEIRNYKLQYSKDLHEKLKPINKGLKNGIPMYGERGKIGAGINNGKGKNGLKGKPGGQQGDAGWGNYEDIKFGELPAISPYDKESQNEEDSSG